MDDCLLRIPIIGLLIIAGYDCPSNKQFSMLSVIDNESLVSSECLQPSQLFLSFLTPISAVQEWDYANN